jgi:hypothetical protein
MARLTKAEAARQLGISRTTLYKLIHEGKISATPDGLIDTAELARVVSTLDVQPARPGERQRTLVDSMPVDTELTESEHRERPERTPGERLVQTGDERQLTSTYRELVNILREQLDTMHQELDAARVERQAAREERAMLLHMLQEMQQRYDRLLEAPRSPMVPAASTDFVVPQEPRGAMRQRILALLRAHPEGLAPAQVRQQLGITKPLAPTMTAMLRDGLQQRLEWGRYVVPE